MDSIDAEKINGLQRDMAELARINRDLVDVLLLTVRRLESLPGAPPMDSAWQEVIRLDQRLQRFLGQERESPSSRDRDIPDADHRPPRIPRN